MNVTIVVLHFETIDDTIDCLTSISQLDASNINLSIVVVDNGSVKCKIDKEKLKAIKNFNVIFIKSPKNLGFACGNNLGLYYAKYNLDPDFVIVVNNDVVFYDQKFLTDLCNDQQNSDFDIIGPAIYSKDFKVNQNPIYDLYLEKKKTRKRLKRFKILKFLLKFNVDVAFQKFYIKCLKSKESKFHYGNDYKLHGACLIFTRKYLSAFDGFFPETFMYFEEDILKYFAVKSGLSMVYKEDLSVVHKEASSTNCVMPNNRNKRQFIYSNSIASLRLLLKLMNEK